MSSPTPKEDREPPRIDTRDVVFWFSGLGTAIAVNLVSNSKEAVKALITALSVSAAIGATSLLRKTHKTSYLRRYAPQVVLTIATPLTVLAAVRAATGSGGDNVMLIAAALVAIAVIATLEGRDTALSRLAGVCAIGTGAFVIARGLQFTSDSTLFDIMLIIGGAIVIIFGGALLAKGEYIFKLLKRRRSDQVLTIGILASIGAIVSGAELIRTPGGTAAALIGIGTAIAFTGSSIHILLTPKRVHRIEEALDKLRQQRNPGEQYPAYGKLVIDFLKSVMHIRGRLGSADLSARATQPARRPESRDPNRPAATVDGRGHERLEGPPSPSRTMSA